MDIETKILLLAMYKKPEVSTKDLITELEETKVFTTKSGKEHLKLLNDLEFVHENDLTLIGVAKAKEVELEFKI